MSAFHEPLSKELVDSNNEYKYEALSLHPQSQCRNPIISLMVLHDVQWVSQRQFNESHKRQYPKKRQFLDLHCVWSGISSRKPIVFQMNVELWQKRDRRSRSRSWWMAETEMLTSLHANQPSLELRFVLCALYRKDTRFQLCGAFDALETS